MSAARRAGDRHRRGDAVALASLCLLFGVQAAGSEQQQQQQQQQGGLPFSLTVRYAGVLSLISGSYCMHSLRSPAFAAGFVNPTSIMEVWYKYDTRLPCIVECDTEPDRHYARTVLSSVTGTTLVQFPYQLDRGPTSDADHLEKYCSYHTKYYCSCTTAYSS